MAILVVVSLFVPLAALLGFVTPPTAHAATSSTLNFQGRLLSNTGSLVADGTYNMQFNLYTVSSGGTTQWTESYLVNATQGVTIKSGYFSVNLGSITSFPSTINWDQEQWLGMTVRGTNSCTPFSSCATPADAEMTPRFKLTAVPYAFVAGSAQAVATNNTNAASTNSNNVTITSGNAAGATSNSGNVSIQVGTATQTRGQINIGTTNAPSSLTVGNNGTQFTLQGSAASTITATNGASTTTFGFVTPTANQTYNLPNSSAGTYTICTTANNCTGLSGYLVQVPTGNTANTPSNNVISPTAASVSGLTVNGTSNATGAVALSVVQTRAFAGLSVSQSAASDGISVTSSSTGNGQTISLTSTSGTQTAGLAITRNGAGGTTTSLLNLTNSAGTVTNAINISGTYTNYINAPSFKVAPSGFLGNMIITAGPGTDNISFTTLGVNINSVNNITLDATGSSLTDIKGANLYLNANSNFATNINNGTSTGSVGIGNTASGAVTLQSGSTISVTSGTTNALTLDSGTTGAINIGTNANAKTITVGNSTGATQLVLNTGTAGANIASNGIANTVQIGNTSGAVAQTINIGTNATASSTNNVTIGSTVAGTTTVQNAATINLNAGTIVGNATTQAIFNTTATTINFAGAATALTVGATTGTTTIRNLVVVQGASVSIGATALQGSLILNDGNGGQTATIQTGNIAANTVLTLPAALGVTDTFCFVTLNNCTGSGVTTVGALDGNTYSANGASIAASTIYLQAATSTHVGLVTIGAQTFGGDKTFNNLVFVNDDLNVGTNTLLVDVSLGRVGIGTPTPTSKLEIDGSYSRTAWGTNGALLEVNNGITVTDTSSTGTVAAAVGSSFARPTFAASSATTYTDVATLYIAGSPIAGANATFTNQYSLWVDGGVSRFDATSYISGGGLTAIALSPINNTATTPDIAFNGSSLQASEADAFIAIDSDNSGTTDQFRVIKDAATSAGTYLLAVDEFAVTSLGNSTLAGTLKVYDGGGLSRSVSLTASGVTSSYTLTLPTSIGSANQCLQNSGTAGILTFAACGSSTLQGAYDNDADGSDAIISMTTADDSIIFRNPAASGSDSTDIVTVDQLNTGAKNALVINNAGTGDLLQLKDAGTTVLKVVDGGHLLAVNSATGTTGTTEATARTNVTTVTLTAAGSFANNDIIFINNAGQDYYTRIVSGGGTTTLTVSPAVSYDASASVTKYIAQNIGATASDYTTQTNRFFQGYFLGGVVTGAGTTTLSDRNLTSTGELYLNTTGATNINGTGNTPLTVNTTATASYINFRTSGTSQGYFGYTSNGSGGLAAINAAGSTVNLLVTNAGYVGIGTVSPTQSLVLNQASSTNAIEFQTNATTRGYFGVSNSASGIINGSAVGDLMLRTQGSKLMISVDSGSTSTLTVESTSSVKIGGAAAGAIGALQLTTGGSSPISNRLQYGTDGTGWKFAISKNQGGTVTDQLTVADSGMVTVATKLQVASTASNAKLSIGAGSGTGCDQASYDVCAGIVAVNTSLYSYGAICAGNSSGDCTGTGGSYLSGSKIYFPNGTYGGAGANTPTLASVADTNTGFLMDSGTADSIRLITNGYDTFSCTYNTACSFGGGAGNATGTGSVNVVVGGKVAACTIGSGTGATNCTSDIRKKNTIQGTTGNLNKILNLNPVSFKWNSQGPNGPTRIGLIAQEVLPYFPEAVDVDEAGFYGLDYGVLVSPLIGAVKELNVKVEDTRARLAVLEAGQFSGNLTVQGVATLNKLIVTGDTVVAKLTVSGKIITAGTAPSAVVSALSGLGASVTATGNDTAGNIAFTTGTISLPANPLAAGEQINATFSSAYDVAPRIALTPKNDKAASVRYYVETSTTGFTIKFIDTPAQSVDYLFDYIIVQ